MNVLLHAWGMIESEAKEQARSGNEIIDRDIVKAAANQLADIIYQWVWYREKHLAPERPHSSGHIPAQTESLETRPTPVENTRRP